MKTCFTPKEASRILGICPDRLRIMGEAGHIDFIRTPGNQRRFDVQGYIDKYITTPTTTVCYCQVSGKGQADDLASQVEYMRSKFPEAEIIKDFGSGINFKRKGT